MSKKIIDTRSFLITETHYDDGTVETKRQGNITDLEVQVYLRQVERRKKGGV